MPPKIEEGNRDEATCPGRGNHGLQEDDGWIRVQEDNTSIKEDLDQGTDSTGPLTRR